MFLSYIFVLLLRKVQQELIKVIQPYWAKQNQLLWDHYAGIVFPFKRQEFPDIAMVVRWDLNELFAYLQSWSATRRCIEVLGDAFMIRVYEKVLRVWSEKKQKRKVVMDFCVIAGRNG